MLTRKTATVLMASILTTIADVGGAAPQGPMYAALMAQLPEITLDDFQRILAALEGRGLVELDPSFLVKITPAGRKLAAECNAALGAHGQSASLAGRKS